MNRSSRCLATAAMAALLLSGCSGGDDEGSTESSDPTTTTEAPATETTTDGGSGGVASGAFTSEECQQLADSLDQSGLTDAITSGDDPTADLQSAADAFGEAADTAPAEVADDLQVLADTYQDLADASADVDWDGIRSGDPAAAAGAAGLATAVSADAGFATAVTNLGNFTRENCSVGG